MLFTRLCSMPSLFCFNRRGVLNKGDMAQPRNSQTASIFHSLLWRARVRSRLKHMAWKKHLSLPVSTSATFPCLLPYPLSSPSCRYPPDGRASNELWLRSNVIGNLECRPTNGCPSVFPLQQRDVHSVAPGIRHRRIPIVLHAYLQTVPRFIVIRYIWKGCAVSWLLFEQRISNIQFPIADTSNTKWFVAKRL